MAASENFDVIVLGAGAAGLFCAAEAGRRGRRVLLLDHARKIGEKIRISGGGRCNFTNIHAKPENFLSGNPKFCVSALSRFSPQDFIDRVNRAGISWHEKKLGQLFCDDSAAQIIDMLIDDCRETHVVLRTGLAVNSVERVGDIYRIETEGGAFTAPAFVVATGGKSIPKIGATGIGYDIAAQFGLPIIEPRPGLVPLTFSGAVKEMAQTLSGLSVEARVAVAADHASAPSPKRKRKAAPTAFQDGFLFTHRGLSGPSILQISSYWREGASLSVDFVPGTDVVTALKERRARQGRVAMATALGEILPKRLSQLLAETKGWGGNLADWSDHALAELGAVLHDWRATPVGSEGYRTAEVTLGGVDTNALNSQTMEARAMPGLYFIGEVVDVTGWLGGYNFQWAWSSAYAAGQAV